MEEIIREMQQKMQEQEREIREMKDTDGKFEKMVKAFEKMAENKNDDKKLVDTRGLGKPPSFGRGDSAHLEKDFPTWQRKVKNYVVGVHADMEAALDWAAETPKTLQGPAGELMLDQTFGEQADENDKIEKLLEKNQQLFQILMNLTEAEANDIVCNSGSKGLEAWRKLARRWDPSTGGRARNMLRFLIAPGRVKLEDLAGSVERWEEKMRRYCNSRDRRGKKREIPEEIQMAALESMTPVDLESHLQLSQTRLETYEQMRAEVVTYLETRVGKNIKDTVTSSREKNADVDSMTNKGGKKGDGGKGKPFSGCFECGGDHYARDCPKANGATHTGRKEEKTREKASTKEEKMVAKIMERKAKAKIGIAVRLSRMDGKETFMLMSRRRMKRHGTRRSRRRTSSRRLKKQDL